MKTKRLRLAEGFPGERLTIVPDTALQRARSLPVCRDLIVTHTGRFDHVVGHYVKRPHGRPESILMVCLAGKGVARVGESLYHMHKGHGIVLPPHQPHEYKADMDDPWSLFWFHFVGERADDYVAALEAEPSNPRFWIHDIQQIEEAFEECYRFVIGGYSDTELIGLSTALARLIGLCRSLKRSPNLRRRQTESRIARALQFMRSNLSRNLTLHELAQRAGLSPAHFGTMFRKQTNCPPLEFHIRLRLHRACELLLTSDNTIAEIANALGYDDPLYFSRLFRQKIGQSPSDYRRNAR